MSEPAEHVALAELGAAAGFRPDARFMAAEPADTLPLPEPEPEPEDPVETAYAAGFAAGAAQAATEAAERARGEAQAREALTLSLTRLDREMVEQLEAKLLETVAALCESALAPLSLDRAALLPRIERAAAMLARTDDQRIIRLNPDDLDFVAQALPAERVQADGSLPRGTIRVESAQGGGVEDSPDQWSRAIREALSPC